MLILDLTGGIVNTPHFKAWKFPGGEIHFKLTELAVDALNDGTEKIDVGILTNLNDSDDIIFLALIVDTLKRTWECNILVSILYMAYQQADRMFSDEEPFSITTIGRMINAMPIDSIAIYDPHSDVAPALLKNIVEVADNSDFIEEVLQEIYPDGDESEIVLLSPDAGAYKKIFKLAEKIGFEGDIECANKYRDSTDGSLHVRLSKDDFEGKDILIIDDICMGGRTFIELSTMLEERNVGRIYLAVSHGVLSGDMEELRRRFDKVFITNSRRHTKALPDFIQVIDLTRHV